MHDGGADDPRFGVISVMTVHATYALYTEDGILGKNASQYVDPSEKMPPIIEMVELSSEDFERCM